MASLHPPMTRAASTALAYLFGTPGIEQGESIDDLPLPGLPAVFPIPGQSALIVVTDEPAPYGRMAMRITAVDRRLDIVLLWAKHDEDAVVTVSVDLTLAALPHAP